MPGDGWNTCRSFKDLLSDEYTTGKVLAHGTDADYMTPDYSYLKGDITKAYSDKVKEVKRSFMFLNLKSEDIPAALIVFDKIVSSNPEYKKQWLLHSIEEPTVKDGAFTVKRTKDGDSGMLYDTVLLPEKGNLDINTIGGHGKEFWVNGENYPNEPRTPDPTNEKGAWRVEVSPKSPANEDYFLNVIQVAKFSIDINEEGSFKIVMTDMKPGTWQVKKDGEVFIPYKWVRSDDGILSFEGGKGRYEFSR